MIMTLHRGWPRHPTMRRLAAMQLVSNIGNAFTTVALVFLLTRSMGWSSAAASWMLSGSFLSGTVGSWLGGRIADRRGSRRVLVTSALVTGLLTVLLGICPGGTTAWAWVAAVLLSGVTCAERTLQTARNTYVGSIGGPDRTRIRAYLRVVLNVGHSLGLGLAALASAIGPSDGLWRVLVVADGLSFLAVGLGARALPAGDSPLQTQSTLSGCSSAAALPVWRNLGFMSQAGLMAALASSFDVLVLGLSLWAVNDRGAPPWLFPVSLGVNTALATVLQMKVASRICSPSQARRMIPAATGWTAAGFMAIGLVGALAAPEEPIRALLLMMSVAVFTLGDLRVSSIQWELEMALVPESRRGEYQGFSMMTMGIVRAVVPVALVGLVIPLGGLGWIMLAGFYSALGPLIARASVEAERVLSHRPESISQAS